MRTVGLTGGIGSGKSTVADMLCDLGAVIVDADAVARDVVAPGGSARHSVLARFGTLDRASLADIVFRDPSALADLNAIVHPAVRARVEARLGELVRADTDTVVVLVVPLLVESASPYPIDVLVVVDAPEEVALARLVKERGMDEEDARRRMAAQTDREQRRAQADLVIVNDGSRERLRDEVRRLWPAMAGASRSGGVGG